MIIQTDTPAIFPKLDKGEWIDGKYFLFGSGGWFEQIRIKLGREPTPEEKTDILEELKWR